MPILIAHLPSTLERPVLLVPKSDSTICSDIKKSASYKKKPANAGAPKAKKPQPIQPLKTATLRPIDILQTLGLAMLPPQHVQQNLASWHWTLIRYAYLIEPPSTQKVRPLRTNALVGDYRHHHMTALSEAFGVGCALSCAQDWLNSEIPGSAVVRPAIDFDYLLGPGAKPLPRAAAATLVKMAPNATRQPDYLVLAEDENKTVRLLVVECKGNSQSKATAIDQLGSAMHQLASIEFANASQVRVPVPLHSYAAHVSKTGAAINIYGVDPPEDEGNPWVRPVIPARREMSDLRESDENGKLLLPSVEEISGRVLRRLEDKAVAWAGAGDSVEDVDIKSLSHQESEFGDIAGATSSLELPDGGTIGIFTGALVETLRAAKDVDPENAHARRTEIRHTLRNDDTEPRRARSVTIGTNQDPERVASVIDDDGLVLRIEVTSEHEGLVALR
jgi:hypothetical protein